MVPETKHIPEPCDRFGRNLRDGIFIGQPRRCVLRLEQSLQFDVIEPDEIERVILFMENRQFDAKHFFVPGGTRDCELIISNHESAPLSWRKMTKDDYGDVFHGELLGGKRACPAMISSSAPTRIGFVNPNSRIEAAMLATCSRLCVRGVFARGISRSIGHSSIWMSMFIVAFAGQTLPRPVPLFSCFVRRIS
jgi:hypothetical protein